ncbi:MAG TPA: hypothetical protein VGN12_25165 [Pirellulales bacterium]|jgi:type IV secretory pathway VirB10-like protein
MRTSLLALVVIVGLTAELLAQNNLPPNVPSAAVADGPMLGPPVIDVPLAPGAPTPPPPTESESKRPRLFRLPQPQPSAASSNDVRQPPKVFSGRWKQQRANAALTEAPLAPGTANLQSSDIATKESAPPKRTTSPRKYGPVELFPKTKESDRAGNPFSIRRPVLAW